MNLPVGSIYTPVGTPYHVYQLILLLLKNTFSELPESHPFRFTEDFNTTGLVVDTVFNKESEIFGKKPTFIVGRGDISTNPIVLGDMMSKSMLSDDSQHTTLVHSSVGIRILAPDHAQVDILANELMNFLVTTRVLLPRLSTVQSITGISVSPVAKYEENIPVYYAVATLVYSMQYKWDHTLPKILLNSIDLHVISRSTTTANRAIIS